VHHPIRVLFLCTGNSARSQMAEGLLRYWGRDDFDVASAGTEPRGVHPLAIATMEQIGIDISQQRSKHLDEYIGHTFEYIITVCERAKDSCPTFPDDAECIHWNFPDPVNIVGTPEVMEQAFRRVRSDLSERIRLWVLIQRKLLRDTLHHNANDAQEINRSTIVGA